MDNSVRILSTRPLDATLIEQAAEKGIVIDVLPFIAIEPVKDKKNAGRIQSLASHPQIAIFTSSNAVEAVAGLLQMQVRKKEQSSSGQSLPWKIFCISGATRQSVQEHFGEGTIAGTAPSAGQLADVILQPEHRHDRMYFFFCGDQRRKELRERLYKEAAIFLNEYIVYRTIRTPHKVETAYDGIAFFSPSAVESFFSINTVSGGTRLFAIGQTTAEAIRIHARGSSIIGGNVPVIVSPSPEQGVLVRQMIDHFQKHI